MKKLWFLLLLMMLTAALLVGCTSNADTLPSPTPGMTNPIMPMTSPLMTDGMGVSPTPDSSMTPAGSSAPASSSPGSYATMEEAKKASEAMGEAIEKLAEVDEAYVVPTGNTALVGLELDDQYQGEVDDRLKKMVLARVQTVDKNITGVAVTADSVMMLEIKALEKLLDGAGSLSDLADKAAEQVKKIVVFTE